MSNPAPTIWFPDAGKPFGIEEILYDTCRAAKSGLTETIRCNSPSEGRLKGLGRLDLDSMDPSTILGALSALQT